MNDRWRDPSIADWLTEGPQHGPVQGLERALAAVHRVDQRPAWAFPGWWLPWAGTGAAAARVAFIGLLLVLVALMLIALAATLPGSNVRILSLLGESGNALIAHQAGSDIYVERADGSQRRPVSDPSEQARSPLFSPDGQYLAYISTSGDDEFARLVVTALDDPASAVTVSGPYQVVATEIPSFDWSPDGSTIAFAASYESGGSIMAVARDGSQLRAITDGTTQVGLPSWSPDGAWIAYRARDLDGQRQRLRMARPDGSDDQDLVVVVAADGFLSKLRWSPVSDSMSYFQNVGLGPPTTALIDLRFGHTVEPWTEGVGGLADNGMPWSPDGQRLAILTASDGVIVADIDNDAPGYEGQLRRLGSVADCWIEWSPDGTALYGGSPDGCQSVVVIPLAEPDSATSLRGSTSGTASWQRLP